MIHFVSDTHWGHKNIIKYSNRPFKSVEEMNEALIDNWNDVVKPTDVVYHLGDFAFLPYSDLKAIARRLNGEKHFIMGNHDKEISKNRNDLLSSHTFASITSYQEVKAEGHMICCFHYGQRVWNKSHHGSFHLYGHSHGSLPPHGRSVDVGVDCKEITSEYRPVSLDEVVAWMSKREFEQVDHHGD